MTADPCTACALCSQNCGLRVDAEENRITAVRADDRNPIAKGYVRNKGFSIPHYVSHARRTTHPPRRRADGTFERVSWDPAVAEIRERLRGDRHAPPVRDPRAEPRGARDALPRARAARRGADAGGDRARAGFGAGPPLPARPQRRREDPPEREHDPARPGLAEGEARARRPPDEPGRRRRARDGARRGRRRRNGAGRERARAERIGARVPGRRRDAPARGDPRERARRPEGAGSVHRVPAFEDHRMPREEDP